MSQTLERIANDFYPTPEPITRALLNTVNLSGVIFEPCAGNSAITNCLKAEGLDVIENDITWPDYGFPRDATKIKFWQGWQQQASGIDWTVTNPPFSEAEKILPLAWEHSSRGIAFLLRLSYLEPTKGRGTWLEENADHLRFLIPVSPRVRFRSDTKGCDSVTCAWFVWVKTWSWQRRSLKPPFLFLSGWRG